MTLVLRSQHVERILGCSVRREFVDKNRETTILQHTSLQAHVFLTTKMPVFLSLVSLFSVSLGKIYHETNNGFK